MISEGESHRDCVGTNRMESHNKKKTEGKFHIRLVLDLLLLTLPRLRKFIEYQSSIYSPSILILTRL